MKTPGMFSKVIAAGIGASAGSVLTAVSVWALGLAWGGSSAAEAASQTAALVPLPLVGVVTLVFTVGGTVFGGFMKQEDAGNMAASIDRQYPEGYEPEHAAE